MNAAKLFTLLLGTFVWFGLIGRAGVTELVLGALVILCASWITGRIADTRRVMPLRRIPGALLAYATYFGVRVLPAMVRHSFTVARISMARRPCMPGAIVAVELPEASPEALVALALGIAFSPDRQIVRIDSELRVLYIHTIVPPDAQTLRDEIRSDYERFIRRAAP